jgi:glucose/arabinose dehydrogenase
MTGIAAVTAFAALGSTALAQPKIKLEPFAQGLNQPLAMVETPDGRMLVIEQWGRVMVVEDGEVLGTPMLDIRGLVIDRFPDFDERGLLGLALHPDFANNGKFYVAYSAPLDWQGDLGQMLWWDHSNVVAEYTVSQDDPNVADPRSGRVISSIAWPQFNHNGHWIGFGPDNMLYVSTGDGGYANDWGIGHTVETGNAQDMTTPLGKMLRLDPETGEPAEGNPFADNPDADPRIWAAGLRNPWRCSFDMEGENQLFCADVQQNSYEEVDIVEAGGNYGWREMEASHCFDYMRPDEHPENCDTSQYIMPILEYENCTARPQGCEGISVTGGYVYRGAHEPWNGKYIYGDWSTEFGSMNGQIKVGSKGADGTWTSEQAEVADWEGPLPYMNAFAQDSEGEVYALTSLTTGPVGSLDTIYKIVPAE